MVANGKGKGSVLGDPVCRSNTGVHKEQSRVGDRISFQTNFSGDDRRLRGLVIDGAKKDKKKLKSVRIDLSLKKFPASCYSPIVKFTVPSPLEPLTTVFGKGTCVSAPL